MTEVGTLYYQDREWSQELSVYHAMFAEDPNKRWCVKGRFTPMDMDLPTHPKCEGYGATIEDAQKAFEDRFKQAPWQEFYASVNKRLDESQAEIDRLKAPVPESVAMSPVAIGFWARLKMRLTGLRR